jgi:polyhydroxyalkanoate synthesis regulator phasin
MSLGEKVLEEIGADKRLKTKLAELIISEPDVKLFIINSLLPSVATKEDIKELKGEIAQLRVATREDIKELRSEIAQLRGEMVQLRNEMHSNFKWTIGVMLTIWGTTAITILLKLIGAI